MNDTGYNALYQMALIVHTFQDTVLECIITDEAVVAHLIPIEEWREEEEDYE